MSFRYTPPAFQDGPKIPDPDDGLHFAVCRKVYYLGTHPRRAWKGVEKDPCGVCAFVWDLESRIPSDPQYGDAAGKPYRKSKKFNLFFTDNAGLTAAIEAHLGRKPTNAEISQGFDFGEIEGKTVCLKLETFSPENEPNRRVQFVKAVTEIQDKDYHVTPGDQMLEPPKWVTEVRGKCLEGPDFNFDGDVDTQPASQPEPRTADAIRPEGVAPHDGSEPAPWD